MARPLEGLIRQDGIHAAAVVIGDRPLVEYLPLQRKGVDKELVTQYAMGDVERLGLLKMDFLGLRNLDVIDEAVRLIEEWKRPAGATWRACRWTTRRPSPCSRGATPRASSSSSPLACATRCARCGRRSSTT